MRHYSSLLSSCRESSCARAPWALPIMRDHLMGAWRTCARTESVARIGRSRHRDVRARHSCARYVRTSDVCQVFQLHAAPGGLRHLAILADEMALPFLPPVLGMRT